MGNLFRRPKAPPKTEYQVKAEARQTKELGRLETQEQSRRDALGRRRQGRGSLISGSERGLASTLGGI